MDKRAEEAANKAAMAALAELVAKPELTIERAVAEAVRVHGLPASWRPGIMHWLAERLTATRAVECRAVLEGLKPHLLKNRGKQ
jgi:hypothetical protein